MAPPKWLLACVLAQACVSPFPDLPSQHPPSGTETGGTAETGTADDISTGAGSDTTSRDPICGNQTIEAGEQCDGGSVIDDTCVSLGMGFDGGELGCNEQTCMLDTSACTSCGNQVVEGLEQCDGTDLKGASCASIDMGFTDGTLACNDENCSFDITNCSDCGNGIREGLEACDGADLRGMTCRSIESGMYGGGELGCLPDCSLDTSACCLALDAPCVIDGTCCSDNCDSITDTCRP